MNTDSTTKNNSMGRQVWERFADDVCLWTGALTPVGLVIGNIAFEALVGVTGLFWLSRTLVMWANPLRVFQRNPILVPWAAWYLTILISLAVNGPGGPMGKGWAHDIVFFRYLLFGMALLDVSERRPVARYLIRGFAAAVLVGLANTISAYIMEADLLGRSWERYTGKLQDALRISGIAAYAVPFFLMWGLWDKKLTPKRRALVLGIALAAFMQLLQTRMRTPILATLGGVLFALVFINVKGKKSLVGWLLAALLILGAVAGFFQKNMWNLASMYDRIYIWKVSWHVFLDHPVFGAGVSAWKQAYNHVALSEVVQPVQMPGGKVFHPEVQTHAHNLVLMLLSATGVLGLAAFAWLFVRATIISLKQTAGFWLGLVGWPALMLVAGLTGYNIYYSWYQALVAFLIVFIGMAESARAGGDQG